MASRNRMRNMDVDEVIEFARTTLKQPQNVLDKLSESEIDGEALLLLTERNIDKVLPGLPAGPCLKLLYKLSQELETEREDLNLSPSTPEVGIRMPLMEVNNRTPQHLQYERGVDEATSDDEEYALHLSPYTPQRCNSTALPQCTTPQRLEFSSPVNISPSIPYSGEFPIDKLVFGPVSHQAFRTGIVSREAKIDILRVIHNKITQLSNDSCYSDRRIRYDAAVALIHKYPQLQERRSVQQAVLSWRNSLTSKAKTVRRSLDPTEHQRMRAEREKYQIGRTKVRASGMARTQNRRSRIMELSEEEKTDLESKQEELKCEFMKPRRDRNQRWIAKLTSETFPLRREEIMKNSTHLSMVLRNWPSLRSADMIIQDLLLIGEITLSSLKDLQTKEILHYANLRANKLIRSHPMYRVLNVKDKADDDQAVIDDAVAVCTLSYLLPTNVKKTVLETHRFLLDIYPADLPLPEVCSDLPGRNQPWILLRGSWRNVEHIQVVADSLCVCSVSSVSEALTVVVALHYIQDVEYNPQVKLALKYVEQFVCGLKKVANEDYKDVAGFANVIGRQ